MCCAIRGSQQTQERQTERQTCSQQPSQFDPRIDWATDYVGH
jgi:hypothetical protein